jgi:hypothetical protein
MLEVCMDDTTPLIHCDWHPPFRQSADHDDNFQCINGNYFLLSIYLAEKQNKKMGPFLVVHLLVVLAEP